MGKHKAPFLNNEVISLIENNKTPEQKLWIAFINGCSQNIVTTWQVFQRYPSIEECDFEKLDSWWNDDGIMVKL